MNKLVYPLFNRQWEDAPTDQIIRIELPSDYSSLETLLDNNNHIESAYYWKERDHSFTSLGFGYSKRYQIDSFTALSDIFSNIHADLNGFSSRARFMGGSRYHLSHPHDTTWASMPDGCYWLPLFEWGIDCSGSWQAIYIDKSQFSTKEDALDFLNTEYSKLSLDSNAVSTTPFSVHKTEISPNHDDWIRLVEQAKEAITASTQLEKLVLSRKKTVQFTHPTSDTSLFSAFMNESINCSQYLFRFNSSTSFFGCSPESLFHIKESMIYSESIAGTIERSHTPEKDQLLQQELLQSPKDQHEHLIVHKMIFDTLNQFCSSVSYNPTLSILKLAQLHHLIFRYQGQLHPNYSLYSIFQALHPTPAVSGLPKDISLDWISKYEPFDRGWFSGTVGWISRDSAQFSVAIRSGLLQSNTFHLFAGAGIISSSDPMHELKEIDLKFSSTTSLLSD